MGPSDNLNRRDTIVRFSNVLREKKTKNEHSIVNEKDEMDKEQTMKRKNLQWNCTKTLTDKKKQRNKRQALKTTQREKGEGRKESHLQEKDVDS